MAGTVISGGSLTFTVLDRILTALMGIDRKVAIGVKNLSGMQWTALNTYFYSGTSHKVLPRTVRHNQALLYDGQKSNSGFRGVVGVCAYRMSDGNTLGIMFSIPYDYISYQNWWNIKVFQGQRHADNRMFNDLYDYNSPVQGNDRWHYNKRIGGGLKCDGFMNSSGAAKLQIDVKRV